MSILLSAFFQRHIKRIWGCKKIYWQDLDLEQIPQDAVDAYYQTEAPHRMYIGEVIDILYGNESDNASL